MSDYPSWPKIPRLSKDAVITEKIDGTNGLVSITRETFGTGVDRPDGVNVVLDYTTIDEEGIPQWEWHIRAGSRNRWLTRQQDNAGFAAWVERNAGALVQLGQGNHYGEWFGSGIQRNYGLAEKRFALFNAGRWYDPRDEEANDFVREYFPKVQPCPDVCTVVPILWVGSGAEMGNAIDFLRDAMKGRMSIAVPGFEHPEGLIVYHTGASNYFKVLFDGDTPKGATK
ncbi:RNA ligase family protein [Asanoa sp. WMMD1127]|uniref:RNA ligase family protein n=1 Tax=Asanoa sp. WMMD1127 TaxID=3016107 RepID=UPI002417C17F|nr:RNA ligase family protein [Asanoa sp. WMMD1127]MDG4825987.1 RNA ligase family protein [Asanoa sp. WMMD1127]